MTLPEMIQTAANVGVAVVAACALIYVHVRQIPALIKAIKNEGVENRQALKTEGEAHRASLHEIVKENREAMSFLTDTFKETLSEDRSRCDQREHDSRVARHHLAERIRHTEQDRAAICVAVEQLKSIAKEIKDASQHENHT